MSKKNRAHTPAGTAFGALDRSMHMSVSAEQEVEYGIIRHDLVRVLVLNVLFLAAILVLYYTNKDTQYLDNWFGSWFRL